MDESAENQEIVFVKVEQEIDIDEEILCPTEIDEVSDVANLDLLPAKSKRSYESCYKTFCEWKKTSNMDSSSESVLLVWFEELSKQYKPSTLWSYYSMLKTTMKVYEEVDIGTYHELNNFIKKKSHGYQSKKSKTLTPEQINQFLTEAPDDKYLLAKVVLIFGVAGSLGKEITKITMQDIEAHGDLLLVKIPDTTRSFIIADNFCDIVKKYLSLRPPQCATDRFFVNLKNGVCTDQVVGKNRIGSMAKEIATYLNLDEAELFTGHCFRRTPVTVLADSRIGKKVPVAVLADRRFSNASLKRDRTPVKSPSKNQSHIQLRSTPRKRLHLGDNDVEMASPEKVNLGKQFVGNLSNGLRGLSHEQLVKMIMDLVSMQEEKSISPNDSLREIILKNMPVADIQPLKEKLTWLRQNVYASLVSSNIDESDYSRAYVHLENFQRALRDQGNNLMESQHWTAVIKYVFAAWSITKELPEWKNQGMHSTTQKCYKHLTDFCVHALRNGTFNLNVLNVYREKLQTMIDDYSDIKICLQILNGENS